MALEQLDPDVCPDCGNDLRSLAWGQPALFRHGGYGATESTERRYCPCGWSLVTAVKSTSPRGC